MTARENPQDTATAHVELAGPDWKLKATVSVPTGPIPLIELLPVVRSLADVVVNAAVQTAEQQGEPISCKKGCGACCRQLVPISEVEARSIRDLVEAMPEPRRSTIRARFAEARRHFEAAGLLENLLHPEQWPQDDPQALGVTYFQQGVACPFLEEESCSIYHDRPIACREYLVTSPAENCARPSPESVRCLKMPLRVWTSLARFDAVDPGAVFVRWVPLILAPEWADAHRDEPPPRPGTDLLRELFGYLTGKGVSGIPLAQSPLDSGAPAAREGPPEGV